MAIARFGGNPGQGSWPPTGAGRGLASGWAVGAQIRQLKARSPGKRQGTCCLGYAHSRRALTTFPGGECSSAGHRLFCLTCAYSRALEGGTPCQNCLPCFKCLYQAHGGMRLAATRHPGSRSASAVHAYAVRHACTPWAQVIVDRNIMAAYTASWYMQFCAAHLLQHGHRLEPLTRL